MKFYNRENELALLSKIEKTSHQLITKMRVGGASNRSLKNIKLKSTEDLRALRANGIKSPLKVLGYKNFYKLTQFIN